MWNSSSPLPCYHHRFHFHFNTLPGIHNAKAGPQEPRIFLVPETLQTDNSFIWRGPIPPDDFSPRPFPLEYPTTHEVWENVSLSLPAPKIEGCCTEAELGQWSSSVPGLGGPESISTLGMRPGEITASECGTGERLVKETIPYASPPASLGPLELPYVFPYPRQEH